MLSVLDKSGNGKGVGFVNRAEAFGELDAAGVSDSARVHGTFNASLSGTFVATLRIERSLDNGVSWHPLTAFGSSITFTGPCQEIFTEPQPGVLYRWNCVSYTSGVIAYRIGQ